MSNSVRNDVLISVIIPVHNVGQYIRATLDSVFNQSLGAKNIEVIMVDDESTDDADTIKNEYRIMHPDNFVYVRIPRGGVSKARNVGISLAHGKYIHFLDGDDLLSKNFYEKTINFLRNNIDDIDLVASKVKFFDDIIDSHPLNKKFKKSRVIDLVTEPNNPLLHAVACVFTREAIGEIRFDERLSISEDVKFLSDIMVRKRKFGVVKQSTYYYRKRTASLSAIAGKESGFGYYLDTPRLVYRKMLDAWKQNRTEPSWAEYTILYDLSYRLQQEKQVILTKEQESVYKKDILDIAAQCDGRAIVLCNFLSIWQKIYILQYKHSDFNRRIHSDGSVVYFGNDKLLDLSKDNVFIDFLKSYGDDDYLVEGYIDGLTSLPGTSFVIDVNGKEYGFKYVERVQRRHSFLGDVYDNGGAFECRVVLPKRSRMSFVVNVGKSRYILPFVAGPFTRFGVLKWVYRRDPGRLIKKQSPFLVSRPYSWQGHLLFELRTCGQILLNWRFGTMRTRLRQLLSRNLKQLTLKSKLMELAKPFAFSIEAITYIPRDLSLRFFYYLAEPFKKKPLWIVSDRGMAAGDNGEALFRYIMQQSDRPTDVYFAISKKSLDYSRMASIGPILNYGSWWYKLKFLLSDKIISSQADIDTTNPFMRLGNRFFDLYNFDFVFLQHGIIRHDHTSWLSRFDKNIGLFITSAEKEYRSILDLPYYYDENQVLLSGLPRYDLLENSPKGRLILAPTYRKRLAAEEATDSKGARHYNRDFKKSEYRKFYNSFMNDPRLLKALAAHNMSGEFYLHPAFAAQAGDFDQNKFFKLMNFPYDYKAAFREGNVLVSDHSSVVFDFAYLKKPVVYAYFDVDTFFDGHSYSQSAFFSDKNDGFGEIYSDYDSLIAGVIKTIENGCMMPQKYKNRVDKFFYKIDKNNCKRVYDAILGMEDL